MQRIRGGTIMRYINLLFTYLLTYLLTYLYLLIFLCKLDHFPIRYRRKQK